MGVLDITGAALKTPEKPKTDDLAEMEKSFLDSTRSTYEKSIVELSERQEKYADLIKEKTDELQALIRSGAYTKRAEGQLRAEIQRLELARSVFENNVQGQKIEAARQENLSRIDKVYGAVTDTIRAQAEFVRLTVENIDTASLKQPPVKWQNPCSGKLNCKARSELYG